MERAKALERLKLIEGQDLRILADRLGITVWLDGRLNKGWAGQTIERYLGLPLNSAQSPNFGSWELKLVSLKRLRSGPIAVKETMAITMIDSVNVQNTPFIDSHLLGKLRKIVVCARMFESKQETTSELVKVATFNLDDPKIYDQVKTDYDAVRKTIATAGYNALTGKMGVLVQPRTKGPGHGSVSRAFYARKRFVEIILSLDES